MKCKNEIKTNKWKMHEKRNKKKWIQGGCKQLYGGAVIIKKVLGCKNKEVLGLQDLLWVVWSTSDGLRQIKDQGIRRPLIRIRLSLGEGTHQYGTHVHTVTGRDINTSLPSVSLISLPISLSSFPLQAEWRFRRCSSLPRFRWGFRRWLAARCSRATAEP